MVYLIYGAPCSGKSTYVKEHFKTGDIVCDVDRIYSAISFNEEHQTELYAEKVASELYKHMLNIIKNRQGRWKNAYVISLANTKEKLNRLKEDINADEVIYIDTPFEVCIERAKERPFYFPWIIEDWFEAKNNDEKLLQIEDK